MRLTVLSVAYPLAPVAPDTAGGAEQVLAQLDAALVAAGHRSLVVACAGSRVAGELTAFKAEPGPLDEAARARAQARCAAAIGAVLSREAVDVVHLHGVDFATYLPRAGPPVLVTLHLPPAWYPPAALRPAREDVWLVPVSWSQHAACPPGPRLLAPIANGVDLGALRARHARRRFALFLGRICHEKGAHLAIAAARRAGVPLLIGGEVFPYPTHRRYFETEIRPHLGREVSWLGRVGPARKRRLLHAARCVVVPSLVPETSSLVAREALACGTPVVATRIGALPEIVRDGRTGWLADSVAALADGITRAGEIDPATCRAFAAEHFPLARTVERYLAVHRMLARGGGGLARAS